MVWAFGEASHGATRNGRTRKLVEGADAVESGTFVILEGEQIFWARPYTRVAMAWIRAFAVEEDERVLGCSFSASAPSYHAAVEEDLVSSPSARVEW